MTSNNLSMSVNCAFWTAFVTVATVEGSSMLSCSRIVAAGVDKETTQVFKLQMETFVNVQVAERSLNKT